VCLEIHFALDRERTERPVSRSRRGEGPVCDFFQNFARLYAPVTRKCISHIRFLWMAERVRETDVFEIFVQNRNIQCTRLAFS